MTAGANPGSGFDITIRAVVEALGKAGYLKLMFPDLYHGTLAAPVLTHATILSEEAASINYAFQTTIATALSCAYPLHRHATPAVRERPRRGGWGGEVVCPRHGDWPIREATCL